MMAKKRGEIMFADALELFSQIKRIPAIELLGSTENFKNILGYIDKRMRYILEESKKVNQFLQRPLTDLNIGSIWARLKFVQRASMSVYSYCLLVSRSFHGVTLKSFVLETVRSLFGIVEELYNKFFEGFKNPQMMVDCHQLMEDLLTGINKVLSLPKDNKTAVLMRMEEVSQSVLNAHTELSEVVAVKSTKGMSECSSLKNCDVIDEFDDETDKFSITWKTSELDVAKDALDTIKTFHNYLCKTREVIKHICSVEFPSDVKDQDCLDLPPDTKEILIKLTASNKEKYKIDYLKNFSNITTQLDATLSLAQMCCSSVQELVSLLRPPTRNVEAAMDTVCLLNQLLMDFLKISKYLTTLLII